MKITYDKHKRKTTLEQRSLDFEDAYYVFQGRYLEFEDDRFEYSEKRFVTIGFLLSRMVYVVWTPTEDGRRIISMRKTNERESKNYWKRFKES